MRTRKHAISVKKSRRRSDHARKSSIVRTMAAKMIRAKKFTVAKAKVIAGLVDELMQAGTGKRQ